MKISCSDRHGLSHPRCHGDGERDRGSFPQPVLRCSGDRCRETPGERTAIRLPLAAATVATASSEDSALQVKSSPSASKKLTAAAITNGRPPTMVA